MLVAAVLSGCVAILVLFLVYREWYHTKHIEMLEERYFVERQMLLDRLMAKDFAQYKRAELADSVVDKVHHGDTSYTHGVANDPRAGDFDISEVGM